MRVVLDTNVLIAAFIARGSCSELFTHVLGAHDLVVGEFILDELSRTMRRKFGFGDDEVNGVQAVVRENSEVAAPASLAGRACRDPDDDNVLAIALGGRADCIVSGDRDLLDLRCYEGIHIVKPSQFWEFERERI